jgi:hypothetical protein
MIDDGTDRVDGSGYAPTELLDAAFGGGPDLTSGLIDLATGATGHSPMRRWLAAVVLGGQGRYAAAAGWLKPLLCGHDPVVASLAGSTLASHLRQLGGHAQARRYDAEALRKLTVATRSPVDGRYGIGGTGARVDALLGLAADAIGLGRTAEAAALHGAAIRAARGAPAWRITVRVHWVAAELALSTDRPDVALRHAEHARGAAAAVGAVRHTVKSIMLAGAAAAAGGTPDGRRHAAGLLTEALDVSLTRGMAPLAWPSALLLADVAPERREHFTKIARNALTSIFTRSDSEMRRIISASPWMPGSLVCSGEPTRTGVELTT